MSINITKGNTHRIRIALTRYGEPMAVSLSSNVVVSVVKELMNRVVVLERTLSATEEGVIETVVPAVLKAGSYSLVVTGHLEGEGDWRMSAAAGIVITTDTQEGGESLTMYSDSFDVTASVTVMQGISGSEEELRERIAEIVEEEYNASEQIREQNEAERQAAEEQREAATAWAVEGAERANAAAGSANDAADNANKKADYAQAQGDYAKAQGDYAKEQGNTAKEKGDYAKAQGDYAKGEGDTAKEKGDYAKARGDYAKSEGDTAKEKGDYAKARGDYAKSEGDIAKEKGDYAKGEGDTAKEKGDYAKAQGDYAKTQGDTAGQDHQRAESDHTQAAADHEQAGSDHTRAESDHATATTDHIQAAIDHTRAGQDHTTATSDHTQAAQDHTTAAADHETASSDHTQAGSDHIRAESDHATAVTDYNTYAETVGENTANIVFINKSFGKYDGERELTLQQAKSGKYVNVNGGETSASGYGISSPVSLNAGDILLVPSAQAVPADVSVIARLVDRTYQKVIAYIYTYRTDYPELPATATADYDATLVYTAVYDESGDTPVLTGWTRSGDTYTTLPATREVNEQFYEPLMKQAVSAMPSTGYYIYLCPTAMTVVISGLTATVSGGVALVVGWGIFKNITTNFVGAPGQSVLAQAFAVLFAAIDGLKAQLENLGETKAVSIDFEKSPKLCGQNMYLEGDGAPASPNVPTMVGQEYLDVTNKKCYKAFSVTGAISDWILLN